MESHHRTQSPNIISSSLKTIELTGYFLHPIPTHRWNVFNPSPFRKDMNVYSPVMISKEGDEYCHCGSDVNDFKQWIFPEYCCCDAQFIFVLKGEEIIEAYWVEEK